MRILSRVIVAGALVVPMALGASGLAMADVAAVSPVPATQIAASDDDHSDKCDKKDGGLLGILNLGGNNTAAEGECGVDGNSMPN